MGTDLITFLTLHSAYREVNEGYSGVRGGGVEGGRETR